MRRVVTAACGVLAQFGGVTLAFAFIATLGLSGFVTVFLRDQLGIDIYSGGVWLFELPGLVLVYTYFQIPLMVIVFLPALDGIRPQWREATESLGGSTWYYWRRVAGPLLAPAFLGATLLLFANAFSAYATAAALVSQGSPIVPLQIRSALTSEVILGRENIGKAMALGMVVVVAVVMWLYAAAAAEDVAMAGLSAPPGPPAADPALGRRHRARRVLPAAAVRDAGVHHPGPGGTLTVGDLAAVLRLAPARRDLPRSCGPA